VLEGHVDICHEMPKADAIDRLTNMLAIFDDMMDESKLDETELPPKSAFSNRLVSKELDEEHYEHPKQLWTMRAMTTLRDWHHFHLRLDVLPLTDVFQAFRCTMISTHGLDCLHFPSLPSMMLQLALKVTEVELELITNHNIFLMIESGIHGRLIYMAQRHAVTNFPVMEYRFDLPMSQLLYLNCSSLYTISQTSPLPVGGFCFLLD